MASKTAAEVNAAKPAKPWLAMTIVGIIAYVGIDIALTFLRPDYNPLHNAESDYGRGPYAWLMDINFILRCLLSLALVRAIFMRFPKNKSIKQAGYLLILWAVASGLLAFFADNPSGYIKIWSGGIHLVLAFIAFIAVLTAMVVFRRLAPVMSLSGTTVLGLTFFTVTAIISLVLMGHAGFRPHSLGGLYERIFLASVLAWEATLALGFLDPGSRKRLVPEVV